MTISSGDTVALGRNSLGHQVMSTPWRTPSQMQDLEGMNVNTCGFPVSALPSKLDSTPSLKESQQGRQVPEPHGVEVGVHGGR